MKRIALYLGLAAMVGLAGFSLSYLATEPRAVAFSLVEVPDYAETKPSVTLRKLALRRGEPSNPDDEAEWKRLDQAYEAKSK